MELSVLAFRTFFFRTYRDVLCGLPSFSQITRLLIHSAEISKTLYWVGIKGKRRSVKFTLFNWSATRYDPLSLSLYVSMYLCVSSSQSFNHWVHAKETVLCSFWIIARVFVWMYVRMCASVSVCMYICQCMSVCVFLCTYLWIVCMYVYVCL